ncbi:7-carboxy-7-deazaguanine synthase QueE [Pontixanthobacter aestiaquae]|uniref:7-carboxy-7-deazaguanine synthase n=1 Tax=Pontixanthobacter aestiaquae TaxID=1509367 RepID=A0A844Z7L9_9SPHN|nr:7-carboxy-7-deazaguanine synthase QueE [Pontixanthobacter aestiaquae]MDN3646115.1 7-carboxy-7-deazaguanine synthase QueE [Pontixanthobacter aestiaquae]MXO82893.1 radical SAM protein [Pontixanthobacter aestiaquae]
MPLVLATQAPGEPEIFASVQGEGPSAGSPCTFIRLSRCNLACIWCDTAYTWHFDGDDRTHRDGETFDRKANQITLDVAEVAERINALGQNRLIITGGEPLMQAGPLAELLELLPDMTVEVETNGTTTAPPRLDIRIDQYNVSPKLAHSGNAAELALIPERLRSYSLDERAFFKFVVASESDVAEVAELVRAHALPKKRVFLMPEGTDSETLRAREKWLTRSCLEHGFRMSDRLHIHLFGDTRGT